MYRHIITRLSALKYVIRPLGFAFVGIVFLSIGIALLAVWAYRQLDPLPPPIFYLALTFLPIFVRGVLLVCIGLVVLAIGIWKLSGVVVIPLDQVPTGGELVLGYGKTGRPLRVAVLSGGAGMLILSNLGKHVESLTCITPLQDPVEYYYRASSLFSSQNVYYVVPTPVSAKVFAELDNGTITNIMHIDHNPLLPQHHVERLFLVPDQAEVDPSTTNGTGALPITRVAREALSNADVIILGPGSLFESILPNLLIDDLRDIIIKSTARTIYVCNLMTEPGLTTGFSVRDHILQIKKYGGFAPDYVLVNAQRIESDVQQIYAASHQLPVYLSPEEYEETAVLASEDVSQRRLVIEGSVVIEADLASSVIQYTASIDNPAERKAVRVLRHDPEKLTTALLELMRWD